jgi:hypothetical protein
MTRKYIIGRLSKILEFIENEEALKKSDIVFNMRSAIEETHCGTACCIAGTAIFLFKSRQYFNRCLDMTWGSIEAEADKCIGGMSYEIIMWLFSLNKFPLETNSKVRKVIKEVLAKEGLTLSSHTMPFSEPVEKVNKEGVNRLRQLIAMLTHLDSRTTRKYILA